MTTGVVEKSTAPAFSFLKGLIFMAEANMPKQSPPEAPKKPGRIVTGAVETRKKSVFSKLVDEILEEDISTMKYRILHDIVVPELERLAKNVINGSTNVIFTRAGSNNAPNVEPSRPRTSYSSYYASDRERQNNRQNYSQPTRVSTDYTDEWFREYKDADMVLQNMRGEVYQDHTVSIARFYDLIGKVPQQTDYNYGWRDLNQAYIRPTNGGWKIIFPRPEQIN